jgi:16S rRNA (guanine966-N2)-methyltransferase
VINENIGLLSIEANESGILPYEVIATDAFAAVKLFARQEKKFDVIFIDPPYGRGLAKKALKTLEGYDILQPNCTVVLQHEKKEILPEKQGRFLTFRQKKYGSTVLTIYNC